MKVVINTCYGGFSISRKCAEWMAERGDPKALVELSEKGAFFGYAFNNDEDRANRLLAGAVEALGSEVCSGGHADLRVVEIPDGVEYTIEEYDGIEHVAEKHRTWG